MAREKGKWRLVLFNDSTNHIDDVIQVLRSQVGMETLQSVQCAILAHEKGRVTIQEGERKLLYEIQDDLSTLGLSTMVEKIK